MIAHILRMFQPSLKLDLFLYTVVFNLVAFLPDEPGCANLLRKIRWPRYNRVTCMYCHSQNIKKNGCYRSYQKFYCKCCKKNFNDKTDTIFHYSHTPLKKWFMVTVSILCIVARMFHNGNIITDRYSVLHMLQIR